MGALSAIFHQERSISSFWTEFKIEKKEECSHVWRQDWASPLQPGAVFKFHSNIIQGFCRQLSLLLEKLKIGIHLKEIGKITLIFILQNAPLQYVISGFQKLTSKLFIPELELPDLMFFPSVLVFLC